MLLGIVLTASLLFATANAATVDFSYATQELWGDVCVNGNRQSPIDIVPEQVESNPELRDLELGDGWTTPITGTYTNKGKTVQFDPTDNTNPAVITTIYPGPSQYRVLQLHMHWGANNEQGSEHTINGGRYPLELHFVHEKVGEVDSSRGDNLAVIGVFAEAADIPISGVWEELNISAIQTFNSSVAVSDFTYGSLLPSSLDYYHYPGSLTTPNCNEIVLWFVLKETIRVPNAYLTYLRQIESASGGPSLDLNFRDVQSLGQRSVQTPGSGSPKIVASVLSILVAMFITMYFS